MFYYIIGGSGSGKSEFAESCCVRLHSEKKLYIATMEPYDEESRRRIARHRKMRDGKGFDTLECYTHLEHVEIEPGCTVLLECMSNLAANEMFSEKGRKEQTARTIYEGVLRLREQAEHLVVVTNQVFSDGITYDPGTQEYLRVMAEINSRAAAAADVVCEVVHGIPVFLKGQKKSVSAERQKQKNEDRERVSEDGI